MTIEKVFCPDDGLECIHPERKEEGSCFNCPKIQEVIQGGERGSEKEKETPTI